MLLWKPSPERIDQANLTRFIQAVHASRGVPVKDYPSLYRWSIEDPEEFWTAVWEFTGIVHSRKWDQVLLRGETMAQTQWFPGARLNFAENLLRHRDERPALVFWNELGRQNMLSWAELYCEVARLSKALRARGIQRGDRVAGFLPNVPAAVIAMLAAASIGAIWSSCSPDFGVKGVLDRFKQIQPKVLFTADGGLYAGKRTDPLQTVAKIVPQIAAIEQVVVVPYLESTPGITLPEKATLYSDFVGNVPESEIQFEQLPFSHPLYIVYSSGTSGAPKCIVHGAGGTLIQHLKELVLHTDLKSESRIFYHTTCGWIMWNWLVSSLATGATVVLYDGSPFHPREDILFDLAQQEQLTVFGTSARYLALAQKKGLKPRKTHSLPSLRTILSTGSPLAPVSFDYVYQEVKPEVCLSSISGGTDLISCFATGNPIGPVYRGELQVRGLGMKVEVYDPVGKLLRGQVGELVCTEPFPSMPVCFWNDPDGEKYHQAYFSYYPGVWRHGDWVELTEHDGLIIHGRSDSTLNPGGVRIGTAEICRQVEELEEVLESMAVGQHWENDIRIVLFVKLRDNLQLTKDLKNRIQQHIRQNTTAHHVPKKILQVPDLPRTMSGKISETAVQRMIDGKPVENREALANPEVLEFFKNLPQLDE